MASGAGGVMVATAVAESAPKARRNGLIIMHLLSIYRRAISNVKKFDPMHCD